MIVIRTTFERTGANLFSLVVGALEAQIADFEDGDGSSKLD